MPGGEEAVRQVGEPRQRPGQVLLARIQRAVGRQHDAAHGQAQVDRRVLEEKRVTALVGLLEEVATVEPGLAAVGMDAPLPGLLRQGDDLRDGVHYRPTAVQDRPCAEERRSGRVVAVLGRPG